MTVCEAGTDGEGDTPPRPIFLLLKGRRRRRTASAEENGGGGPISTVLVAETFVTPDLYKRGRDPHQCKLCFFRLPQEWTGSMDDDADWE